MLVSADSQGNIVLWNEPTSNPKFEELGNMGKEVFDIVFGHNNGILGTTSWEGFAIWSLADRSLIRSFNTGRPWGAPVSLSFLFKDDSIVAWSQPTSNRIFIEFTKSGATFGSPLIFPNADAAFSLASPNEGESLLSTYYSGEVVQWDFSLKSWQEKACRIANRNMTIDEWRGIFSERQYHPTCLKIDKKPETGDRQKILFYSSESIELT